MFNLTRNFYWILASNSNFSQQSQTLNDVIRRALVSVNVPSVLEPYGIFRHDGRRPDGMTLVPRERTRALVRGATCVDTLAASHLRGTSFRAGAASEAAELKTIGPWGPRKMKFLKKLHPQLVVAAGDKRAGSFLAQRLSIAIQRGNATRVLDTIPRGIGHNGHGASVTGQHIPDFGDQLTAAAKLNVLHNDKHDVTAQAFATRTFPNNPNVPNFDTYGGKVGYTYDNKMGASLGMQHTDLFKNTDYSAMGNYNLLKGRDSSLDFNAGMSKSVSPYIPSSRWEPSAGLSFTKWF